MAKINLLPWRQELKKQRQQEFIVINAAVALSAAAIIIVRVFDELARNMPNKVYLSSVKREGDKFVIEGYAESNTQVSSLLRNLNASTWFKNPVLSNVVAEEAKETKGGKVVKVSSDAKKNNRFALTVELEAPEPDPTEEKTGVSKTKKEASK